MAVFNKKNALIGWAVLEGARILKARNGSSDEAEEAPKKKHRVVKATAAAMGTIAALGGVAALRRRAGGPGPGPGE